MNKIEFMKMHGAGNDFILVDDREERFSAEARKIASLATRRTGIGSEGVILVQKSDVADFKMRFYNPDGTEVGLCGNGARCVAAFARDIGAALSDHMRFETLSGIIEAEIISKNLVKVKMPDPKDLSEDYCIIGVPHKIVPVENLAKVNVEEEGRRIRRSSEFSPEGTNVDFVTYFGDNHLSIRTYERGVEAESGACGTGAVASAVIGVVDYGMSFPVKVLTRHGYELIVDGIEENGEFSSLTLTGPIARVYSGVVDCDSLVESDLV